MELLIFSDSHGNAEAMRRVLSRQPHAPDAVLFLGDGLRDAASLEDGRTLWYPVRGNCDWFSGDAPTERRLYLEGHELLLLHGHEHGVKGGVGALLAYAARTGADVVLFGHTHLPREEVIPAGEVLGGVTLTRPLYLFNPGSVREGSFGFLSMRGEQVLLSHGEV